MKWIIALEMWRRRISSKIGDSAQQKILPIFFLKFMKPYDTPSKKTEIPKNPLTN